MSKVCLFIFFIAVASATAESNGPTYQPLHTFAQPVSYIHAPAPVYETAPPQEVHHRSLDGTEQTVYSKSLITPFSTIRKYEARSNTGILTIPNIHAVPTLHSTSYIAHDSQNISPFIQNYAPPHIAAKSLSSNLVTPVHAADNGNPAVKTTITYSEAPLVSHMTFTGLGTSYSW